MVVVLFRDHVVLLPGRVAFAPRLERIHIFDTQADQRIEPFASGPAS